MMRVVPPQRGQAICAVSVGINGGFLGGRGMARPPVRRRKRDWSLDKFSYDCRSSDRVSRFTWIGYPSGDLTPARRKAGRFCFVERSRDPANVAIKKIEAAN
jgi:hypothetical protein